MIITKSHSINHIEDQPIPERFWQVTKMWYLFNQPVIGTVALGNVGLWTLTFSFHLISKWFIQVLKSFRSICKWFVRLIKSENHVKRIYCQWNLCVLVSLPSYHSTIWCRCLFFLLLHFRSIIFPVTKSCWEHTNGRIWVLFFSLSFVVVVIFLVHVLNSDCAQYLFFFSFTITEYSIS